MKHNEVHVRVHASRTFKNQVRQPGDGATRLREPQEGVQRGNPQEQRLNLPQRDHEWALGGTSASRQVHGVPRAIAEGVGLEGESPSYLQE